MASEGRPDMNSDRILGEQMTVLIQPRREDSNSPPFSGDAFQDRATTAHRLTGFIDRLRTGAVIAIDAPWGSGKTWFGKNWKRKLESDGYETIWVDAFSNDYVEDPFILLASSISELARRKESGTKDALQRSAIKTVRALLPLAAKTGLTILANATIGSIASEAIRKTAEEIMNDAEDVIERQIAEQVVGFEQQRATLQAYQAQLSTFCSELQKPLVFFVDELDRCRPTYAIRLIERIKHFFDVPNLVFVLVMNRVQVHAAINGVYGDRVNAAEYLQKFIHLTFSLPKLGDAGSQRAGEAFVNALAIDYQFGKHQEYARAFGEFLSAIAQPFRLSLRDLEKAFAMLAVSVPSQLVSSELAAYLIAIRLKSPEIVPGIVAGDNDTFKLLHGQAAKAQQLLHTVQARDSFGRIVTFLDSLTQLDANFSPEALKVISALALGENPRAAKRTIRQVISMLEGLDPR